MRSSRMCALLLAVSIGAWACESWAQAELENPEQLERPKTQTPGQNEDGTTPNGTGSEPSRDELKRELANRAVLTLPGAVDPDTYRVGPGDVFQISAWGGITRNLTIEVGPEGTVLMPHAGTIQLDGKTLREARTEILDRLRAQFKNLSMDVRLLRPRRFTVYVTGQVSLPGPYEAGGSSRSADVVLRADPLQNASLRAIVVTRRNGETEVTDLDLFLRSGNVSLNPWLRDGDVIHVPPATEFVHVLGAVARPLRYELGPRDSLRTLLALGAGLLPSADSTRALFVRWSDGTHNDSTWVQVRDVLSGSFNPPLRRGDRFYVYFQPTYQLQHEAIVLGQVQRPGVYPITVGRDRVSDVIRAAGSFLQGADLAAIRVRRQSPTASSEDPELQRLLRLSRRDLTNSEYAVLNTKLAAQREEYRVDWTRIKDSPELDVLLVSGDIVQVDRLVSSVRVDGQVRRPGILAYKAGQDVESYVREAGGYSERAWHSKVRITRSVTGQTFLARDVPKLDPGDFIWVPERPDVTFWEQMRGLLGAAAEIATVVLAFRAVNL